MGAIGDQADYDAVLKAIDRLIEESGEPDTPQADHLKVLVTLVEAYEARRWTVDANDRVSMITHVMGVSGYRQKNLTAVIGSQPHASEVLNRRRALSLPMIRVLSAEWDLPANTPMREHDLVTIG